ncbi:MAG: hypothetical protein J0L75_16560 [Spirochaetes bacterium]|nr:hypothetical protein [Spirochaetota bacterium]
MTGPTVKNPLLTDFLRGVFHRLNNYLGPFYGKLDLILLFNKPEHRKLLSTDDLETLKAGLAMIYSFKARPDVYEFLSPFLIPGEAPPADTDATTVRSLMVDSSGRTVQAMKAAQADLALRGEMNRFLQELSAEIPVVPGNEAWTGPEGIRHRSVHLDLQAVIAAIRRLETRWFNLA